MCFYGRSRRVLKATIKKTPLLIHTFGLSVLGSLSTFSMAVRASNPPTTLRKQKNVLSLLTVTTWFLSERIKQGSRRPHIYISYVKAHYLSHEGCRGFWGEGETKFKPPPYQSILLTCPWDISTTVAAKLCATQGVFAHFIIFLTRANVSCC